ncbi:MAG: EthD domain-containing protein [Gammaproteobacteria bacterium]
MEKIIVLLTRHPSLDIDAFRQRYVGGANAHGPLTARHMPRLRRYAVSIVDGPGAAGADLTPAAPGLRVDAVEELWFDRLEDFTDLDRLWDDDAGMRAVTEDGRQVWDCAWMYHVGENVVKDWWPRGAPGGPSKGVNAIFPVTRKAGIDHAQFVRHWHERHAPLALLHHGMARYVQNEVKSVLAVTSTTPGRTPAPAPQFDGIATLHFPTAEDLHERMMLTPRAAEEIAADVARFVGGGESMLATEYVIRWN